MDKKDIALWRTFDMRGFKGLLGLVRFNIDLLLNHEQTDDEIKECIKDCRHYIREIAKKYAEVRLDVFDGRFPVRSMRKLKDTLVPELVRCSLRMDKSKRDIERLLSATGKILVESDNITRNPFYLEYRKSVPEEQRG